MKNCSVVCRFSLRSCKQTEVEALQKQLQTKLSETDVLPAKPEETAQQGKGASR